MQPLAVFCMYVSNGQEGDFVRGILFGSFREGILSGGLCPGGPRFAPASVTLLCEFTVL